MRKTLSAIALLLLLTIGVVVNSLLPSPGVPARKAIGQTIVDDKYAGVKNIAYYANAKGPRVVLVASAGREASDYNELVNELAAAGYRVLAVEYPGIKDAKAMSAEDIEEYGLAAYTVPVNLTLIDDTNYDDKAPYVLIGHAYGNRVVRMATIIRHENVKGVILLAAGGQVPMPPKAEKSLKNVFNPLRTYRSRMKDVRYAFFADGNEIPPHWKRGWHTKTAIAQGKAVAVSAGDENWHCAGGVPMLIVQPMQDRIAPPENAYALRDKCPQDVEIVEVQNAGHALLPEQPEAVADAVLDFLAKYHPTHANKDN